MHIIITTIHILGNLSNNMWETDLWQKYANNFDWLWGISLGKCLQVNFVQPIDDL